MNSPSESDSPDPERGKSPAELLRILLDMLHAVGAEGTPPKGDAAPSSGRMGNLLSEIASLAANITPGTLDQFPGLAGRASEMSSLLAEAYLVAVLRGLRYWRRVAGTWTAHEKDILGPLATALLNRDLPREQVPIIADALRGWLRQLGDIALQEARAFQQDLDVLSAGVTEDLAERGAERRYWKAKP
jgi:hypothetical protein